MQKERYFISETLHTKALDMLEAVRELRFRHGNIVFNPARAALLVLDMQEYFLSENSHAFIPSAPAIIPNIQSLIKAFVARQRSVIFTCHLNTDENAGVMAKWWKDLIRPESGMSHIITGLDTSKGIVLRKTQYDAFYETSLETNLHATGVGQVVITGVMTHLCCETTARSAFVRGLEVFFVVDGTATYTEAFHRAALLNLSHGFAVPVLTEEIFVAFEGVEI